MTDNSQWKQEPEDSFTGDEEGTLPAQMGAGTPTIMPGVHFFRLPANLDQCWEAKDYKKRDDEGKEIEGTSEQHFLLKFDADNPLICVDGIDSEFEGLPAQATITTIPRRRGKKTDKDAPMVHDLAYLVRTSLGDKNTKVRFRSDWVALVNRYAGHVIRLDTGLSARCDPERVRYISNGEGGSVEDPDGNCGCDHAAGPAPVEWDESGNPVWKGPANSKIYTQGFKTKIVDPETGKEIPAWTDHVVCKGCGAMLRGFFRIERFLEPLASTQVVQQR